MDNLALEYGIGLHTEEGARSLAAYYKHKNIPTGISRFGNREDSLWLIVTDKEHIDKAMEVKDKIILLFDESQQVVQAVGLEGESLLQISNEEKDSIEILRDQMTIPDMIIQISPDRRPFLYSRLGKQLTLFELKFIAKQLYQVELVGEKLQVYNELRRLIEREAGIEEKLNFKTKIIQFLSRKS